jgi:hypothetical protein
MSRRTPLFISTPVVSQWGQRATSGGAAAPQRRVDLFTASGTWTAPAGVTYAIAHIVAGGGSGGSYNTNGSPGGSSSAFSETVSGGRTGSAANAAYGNGVAAPANSGLGGLGNTRTDNSWNIAASGGDGTYIVKGMTVTPGTGYTITIGSGGTGGGGDGGSGRVWIEYEVSA